MARWIPLTMWTLAIVSLFLAQILLVAYDQTSIRYFGRVEWDSLAVGLRSTQVSREMWATALVKGVLQLGSVAVLMLLVAIGAKVPSGRAVVSVLALLALLLLAPLILGGLISLFDIAHSTLLGHLSFDREDLEEGGYFDIGISIAALATLWHLGMWRRSKPASPQTPHTTSQAGS